MTDRTYFVTVMTTTKDYKFMECTLPEQTQHSWMFKRLGGKQLIFMKRNIIGIEYREEQYDG